MKVGRAWLGFWGCTGFGLRGVEGSRFREFRGFMGFAGRVEGFNGLRLKGFRVERV